MGATAGIVSLIVGTGTQVASSQAQARAARLEGDYAGTQDERNAAIARLQASDAIARGDLSAGQRATAGRVQGGQAVAAFSGQGVDVSVGTPTDVGANNENLTALDIATIKNNAAREAWGYTTQAESLDQAAQFARRAGRNAATGYQTQAFNTLLTGGANAFNFGKAAASEGAWGWMKGGGSTPNLVVPSPLPGFTPDPLYQPRNRG